jgi:hypothetical protein
MQVRFKSIAILSCVMLVVGIGAGSWGGYKAYPVLHPVSPADMRFVGDKTVCFTPQEDCIQFVVDAISIAKKEILVQAYNFTSPEIIVALAHAKANKIDVRVILDKSNEQERYHGGIYLFKRDVPVWIDYKPAIAHSKVMIFDEEHVLTGSLTLPARRNGEMPKTPTSIAATRYMPNALSTTGTVAKRYRATSPTKVTRTQSRRAASHFPPQPAPITGRLFLYLSSTLQTHIFIS